MSKNLELAKFADSITVDGVSITFDRNIFAPNFGGANITTADEPPVGSDPGDLWYDTIGGQVYLFYNDGDSSQWVSITPTIQWQG